MRSAFAVNLNFKSWKSISPRRSSAMLTPWVRRLISSFINEEDTACILASHKRRAAGHGTSFFKTSFVIFMNKPDASSGNSFLVCFMNSSKIV